MRSSPNTRVVFYIYEPVTRSERPDSRPLAVGKNCSPPNRVTRQVLAGAGDRTPRRTWNSFGNDRNRSTIVIGCCFVGYEPVVVAVTPRVGRESRRQIRIGREKTREDSQESRDDRGSVFTNSKQVRSNSRSPRRCSLRRGAVSRRVPRCPGHRADFSDLPRSVRRERLTRRRPGPRYTGFP